MASYEKIESQERLDELFSDPGRVVVFKHSLTCPISTTALRQFERFLADHEGSDETFGLIEVQRQRGLSNGVAERTGVRHESPQALVLSGGEVTWHASHGSITAQRLAEAVG